MTHRVGLSRHIAQPLYIWACAALLRPRSPNGRPPLSVEETKDLSCTTSASRTPPRKPARDERANDMARARRTPHARRHGAHAGRFSFGLADARGALRTRRRSTGVAPYRSHGRGRFIRLPVLRRLALDRSRARTHRPPPAGANRAVEH